MAVTSEAENRMNGRPEISDCSNQDAGAPLRRNVELPRFGGRVWVFATSPEVGDNHKLSTKSE